MSILFLILKIIGILILIPILLLLILLIFPICYQIEGDFDGKSPKAQVKVSWAVIFLRAKAFYELLQTILTRPLVNCMINPAVPRLMIFFAYPKLSDSSFL